MLYPFSIDCTSVTISCLDQIGYYMHSFVHNILNVGKTKFLHTAFNRYEVGMEHCIKYKYSILY